MGWGEGGGNETNCKHFGGIKFEVVMICPDTSEFEESSFADEINGFLQGKP